MANVVIHPNRRVWWSIKPSGQHRYEYYGTTAEADVQCNKPIKQRLVRSTKRLATISEADRARKRMRTKQAWGYILDIRELESIL